MVRIKNQTKNDNNDNSLDFGIEIFLQLKKTQCSQQLKRNRPLSGKMSQK